MFVSFLDDLLRVHTVVPDLCPAGSEALIKLHQSGSRCIGSGEMVCTHNWDPLLALPRLESRLTIHLVDLLEREGRRLIQEEKDDDGAEHITTGKDVAVTVINVVGDERGEEGEEEILNWPSGS